VLGGLALSSVLVIFVIPALFTMLYRLRGVFSRPAPSADAG